MLIEEKIWELMRNMGMKTSPDVMEKCGQICMSYLMNDAEKFLEKWTAFSFTNLNGEDMTTENLERFVLHEFGKPFKMNDNQMDFAIDPDNNLLNTYISRTPMTSKSAQESTVQITNESAEKSLPVTSQMITIISAIFTFGDPILIQNTNWITENSQQIVIQFFDCLLNAKGNYMFDPLHYQNDITIDRTCRLAKKFIENNFPKDKQPIIWPLSKSSQNDIVSFGIVCDEYDEESGRLNQKSVVLVGVYIANEEIIDKRPPMSMLDLRQLDTYGLFPGQVILVEGRNPKGDVFYAKKILSERELQQSPVPNLKEPISFVIASGPFTKNIDGANEELHSLIGYCINHKPDVLIMIGPFLDKENVNILCHKESFVSYFKKMVCGILDAIGKHTHVVMVSSHRDAHSTFIYPTSPYQLMQPSSNLTFLPDPCTANINGICCSITSTDILKHLNDAELTKNSNDTIKRLTNYLLYQGTFYPLQPPSKTVNIDETLKAKYAQIEVIPNILILPSDLRCFIRNINNCLVINPGRLSKSNGGTFARCIVKPPKDKDDSLLNYVACQIVRL